MKKYKQVEPGTLKVGDEVWIKAKIDYTGNSYIDASIMDEVGVKDYVYQVPLEDVLVEDNDGKKH